MINILSLSFNFFKILHIILTQETKSVPKIDFTKGLSCNSAKIGLWGIVFQIIPYF